MAVKKKINFNVDKLKLSFIQPSGLFEELSLFPTNKYLNYGDFTLHIIDNGKKEGSKKPSTKMLINVLLSDGTLLGEFTFNNSAKYDGLCFFKFANSALYKCEGQSCGEKQNCQTHIQFIAEALNLKLNSQTEIELAADVNFNPIPKIRKLIKDYKNYDMIYNGKRIIDEGRKIEDYGEYFGRSRKKLDRTPTLYFSQSKSDGLQMKLYDKSKEIKEESPTKSYIEEWNDFNGKNIYRIEITIRWEQYKKWLQYLNSADCPLYSDWKQFISEGEGEHIALSETDEAYLGRSEALLTMDAYKCPLWKFCTDRMLYFRNRRTNEVVSLLDIALGWKQPQQ